PDADAIRDGRRAGFIGADVVRINDVAARVQDMDARAGAVAADDVAAEAVAATGSASGAADRGVVRAVIDEHAGVIGQPGVGRGIEADDVPGNDVVGRVARDGDIRLPVAADPVPNAGRHATDVDEGTVDDGDAVLIVWHSRHAAGVGPDPVRGDRR